MSVLLLIFAICAVLVLLAVRHSNKKMGPMNVNQEVGLELRLEDSEKSRMLAYVYLSAWLIKKNAQDSEEKVAFVFRFTKLKFQRMEVQVSEAFHEAQRFSTNIRSISNWIINRMPTAKERQDLIDFLLDLGFVSGDIIDREYVAIARLAELIGVRFSYVESQINVRREQWRKHQRAKDYADYFVGSENKLDWALRSLNLEHDASSEMIKKAYRKLAKELHPDVQHNQTDVEREIAIQRFIEIQAAYEFLTS